MSFKLKEDHLIVLIGFMENHPEFATGRLSVVNAREKFRELWKELANNLNSLGFGTRTVEKWQKTWTDYKVNLKKKASEIKRQIGVASAETDTITLSHESGKCEDLDMPSMSQVGDKSKCTKNESDKKYITDHDYLVSPTPFKKRKPNTKADDLNLLYEDTITAFKNIEHTVNNRVQGLENSVSANLEALIQIVENGLENINQTLKSFFDRVQ